MSVTTGRFLISSGITSMLSFSRQLPTSTYGTIELGTFSTVSGTHSLFVSLKVSVPGFATSKQYSISVQYDQTSNQWFKLIPLDEITSADDFDLDVKSDGLVSTLRLRRTTGSIAAAVFVNIQNLGTEDSSFTATFATGTDLPPESSISSIPHGSTGVDHNTLTNRGANTHAQIDAHIEAPSPHSGHENKSDKDQPDGYAGLDSNGKVPSTSLNIGNTPGTVCAGDDPRLSDGLLPGLHADTHSLGATDEINLSDLAGELPQAKTHGTPDTDLDPASLHHTLGTGANQAAAGNHTHVGNVQLAAGQIIGGHKVLALRDDGLAVYADITNPAHVGRVVGMSTGATSQGLYLTPQSSGEIELGSWAWTQGEPVYLSTNGELTQGATNGTFVQIIGFAVLPTKIFISVQPPILR